MFWKKKNEPVNTNKDAMDSHEYEKCLLRMSERDFDVAQLKVKLKAFETDLLDLRGKLNRKFWNTSQAVEKENINIDEPKYI